jgi:hypothetical protein
MSHQQHQSCIQACQSCAQECEHCGNACIQENRPACARACIDCADVCWTSAGFMSRDSQFMKQHCRLCAEVCHGSRVRSWPRAV